MHKVYPYNLGFYSASILICTYPRRAVPIIPEIVVKNKYAEIENPIVSLGVTSYSIVIVGAPHASAKI